MPEGLEFVEAAPESAAARLDAGSIHLWRLAYQPTQRRAPLRGLLGTYLGRVAAGVVLTEGAHGKPELADTDPGQWAGSGRALEFNWSHSGAYALVALSSGPALGVDVERLGRKLPALELARRYFDPAEAKVLASLPPSVRGHAFMGLWCAKEAVLKALGRGLAYGLHRLSVASVGGQLQLRRLQGDDAGAWQLQRLALDHGLIGALAWRGGERRIRLGTLASGG